MRKTLVLMLLSAASLWAAERVTIRLQNNSRRELHTEGTLDKVLAAYDLSKYTFTRKVLIEERAMNHAFPVLTLNARFADSPADLLSSYVHEQLHWYLREHASEQRSVVAALRQLYPSVPVGLPEGAETEYSTYGHLVDCYLEVEADRRFIGPEQTRAVVRNKGYYTWIYATIFRDEAKIAALVDQYHLRIN